VTTAGPATESPWSTRWSAAQALFLASAVGLFLELALIRWISVEVRVFAYCKNLVLVASFLGFGAGCLRARSRVPLEAALMVLLLLSLVVRLPWSLLQSYGPVRVSEILAELSGFQIFHTWDNFAPNAWGFTQRVAFAVGWTAVIFFAVAAVMFPFGRVTGAAMAQLPDRLRAYSINVLGSLVGILSYTALTSAWLPPVMWFVPAALLMVWLAGPELRYRGAGYVLCLLMVQLPDNTATHETWWSAYQKLTLEQGTQVVVNNVSYQIMNHQPANEEGQPSRFNLPYRLGHKAGRVLIVGAGTGNDVSAALNGGAESVTAVEIDRVIYEIGREMHPDHPYSDRRVETVVDDARHFLRNTSQTFDTIVFSHLDSHTVLSSYTNVRLDNYIHTTEAFAEARQRMAQDGLLYVTYYAEKKFIGGRLHRNLLDAMGHAPLALEARMDREGTLELRNVFFLSGAEEQQQRWASAVQAFEGLKAHDFQRNVEPSTDAWPFLMLEDRSIPPVILLISMVIILMCAGLAWRIRPKEEPFDGRVFFMGAAFMLLETHNVSRLALVFGTTWSVNAWVIGAILAVILLANAFCERQQRQGRVMGRWPVVGLFTSLAVAWAMPLNALGGLGFLGAPLALAVMTLPLFFAGLVFADAFTRSKSPAFALGWNVLGAVAGGMLETLSYVLGIPALLILGAALYALALRQRAGG
jgi:hypothetical protein